MSENAASAVGIKAGDMAFSAPFKRTSPNSQGYTIRRIEPEKGDLPLRDGHILGYNAFADCKVYDIRQDEIVYPITDKNRTQW